MSLFRRQDSHRGISHGCPLRVLVQQARTATVLALGAREKDEAHLACPGGLPPALEPGREVGRRDKSAVKGDAVGRAAKALQQRRCKLHGLPFECTQGQARLLRRRKMLTCLAGR